jgi:macrolide transport system ATP-binding/permease protein
MIELQNINKTYSNGKISFQALKGIDLKIAQGEFVAIMGASGSGKSTLLHILGFLDPPDNGSYKFFEKDVSALPENKLTKLRNLAVGFVFQQFHLLAGVKAHENVSLPQIYAGRKNFTAHALEKLKDVGLQERADHVPNELSGGERQRVAIARALVNEPAVLFADEPTGNLDTKSEAEIMNILKDLHAKGMTVIMVTHEHEIAAHAHRIITMRDGKIISDEKKDTTPTVSQNNYNKTVIEEVLAEDQKVSGSAEFIDHIKQALHSILVKKLRSFLSMLGILIGVAAVIAMLALGTGATKTIEQDLSRLGSNLLIIRPGSHRQGGVSSGGTSRFTLKDSLALQKLPLNKYVSAQVSLGGQAVHANKNWSTAIIGAEPDYAKMRNNEPTVGRFFTQQEFQAREKVALIGKTVATELFGESSPLGKTIKLNRINFKVIGLTPEKGYARGRDDDDKIVIPITTAMYRVMGKEYVSRIEVEVVDSAKMEQAKTEINRAINKLHNWPLKDEKVDIRDMAEIQNAIKGTIKTISVLLGSVAAIALLVGGIGIMNIMLVSVTERTREIGLRKAIGAGKKDILNQFLIEAIVMTVCGGVLGVIFGYSISWAISLFSGWTTEVSTHSVLISAGFSIVVGIIFGIWPARQAANLNTIEALRYE